MILFSKTFFTWALVSTLTLGFTQGSALAHHRRGHHGGPPHSHPHQGKHHKHKHKHYVVERRVIERPVIVERRIIERPVIVERRIIERPVIVERHVVERPVIVEEHRVIEHHVITPPPRPRIGVGVLTGNVSLGVDLAW
jgi:hypothetical protein